MNANENYQVRITVHNFIISYQKKMSFHREFVGWRALASSESSNKEQRVMYAGDPALAGEKLVVIG